MVLDKEELVKNIRSLFKGSVLSVENIRIDFEELTLTLNTSFKEHNEEEEKPSTYEALNLLTDYGAEDAINSMVSSLDSEEDNTEEAEFTEIEEVETDEEDN